MMITPRWPAPAHVHAGTLLPHEAGQLPANTTFLKQVHGKGVVHLPQPGSPEADAAITSQAQIICMVKTADCLPLLITNAKGTEVAAIHAGWRGLAAGVIEAALSQMQSPAQDLQVWLGPAISQSVFEVGQEVYDAFIKGETQNSPLPSRERSTKTTFLAGEGEIQQAFIPSKNQNRYMADLYLLAKIRLRRLGVALENIYGGNYCTYSDTQFASYRRGKGTDERQYNFIWFE